MVVNLSGLKYVNPSIFKDFSDCVRAVICEQRPKDETILYFKLLKNSDIVKMIHEKSSSNRQFGYCYLAKSCDGEQFSVYNATSELQNNLLSTVFQAKKTLSEPRDVTGHKELKLKIGYFKILTDDDFVSEIHVVQRDC